MAYYYRRTDELYHHGIKGQKWGIRRFQNPDGSLTAEGKKRYAAERWNESFTSDDIDESPHTIVDSRGRKDKLEFYIEKEAKPSLEMHLAMHKILDNWPKYDKQFRESAIKELKIPAVGDQPAWDAHELLNGMNNPILYFHDDIFSKFGTCDVTYDGGPEMGGHWLYGQYNFKTKKAGDWSLNG